MSFIQIPPNAIICRYAQVTPGQWAVVSVSGEVLAGSFFELRERFAPVCSINGAGSWVVMVPRPSSFSQGSLF